jgi:hypothetical protein
LIFILSDYFNGGFINSEISVEKTKTQKNRHMIILASVRDEMLPKSKLMIKTLKMSRAFDFNERRDIALS